MDVQALHLYRVLSLALLPSLLRLRTCEAFRHPLHLLFPNKSSTWHILRT